MGQGALYWRRSGSESSAQWLQLDRSIGISSSSGGGGGGGGSVVVIIMNRDVWPARFLLLGDRLFTNRITVQTFTTDKVTPNPSVVLRSLLKIQVKLDMCQSLSGLIQSNARLVTTLRRLSKRQSSPLMGSIGYLNPQCLNAVNR